MISPADVLDTLPRCASERGSGRLRVEPEDFQVVEVLAPCAVRDGNFIWVQVRKRNLNTRWVALGLARHFAVGGRDVTWAGLKDRRAVTTQWFSVNAKQLPLRRWFEPGTALVAHCRARTALTPGEHQGNRFVIRVRELTARAATETALQRVHERGAVPNYFGAQRFGRGAGNVAALRAWAQGETRPKDKFEQGIWLSAGRSWLFNLALAERVRAGDWARVVAGDWVVAGMAEGPLWGEGRSLVLGEALRRCHDAWQDSAWLPVFLATRNLGHGTRPWQLQVDDLRWHWHADGDLTIAFQLGPGGFATTVLRELLHETPRERTADHGRDDEVSEAT